MAGLKTLLFTLVVPGTVAGLVPYLLLAPYDARPLLELGVFRYAGLLPGGCGAALYAWSAWGFAVHGRGTPAPIDPPRELVVRGPYRHVRNPMYIAVLAVLLGEAVFFEAAVLFGYAAAVTVAFNLFVFVYEEPTLRARFGAAYTRYCEQVPRWLPRGGRSHPVEKKNTGRPT